MTTQRKVKRKLSDINFESEGSHIALVSKEQGHGANGHHYALVMKATSQFSEEFLEKASKVKVEMDITEYLTRFYGLWYEDAEILARALGFTTQRMEDEADEDEFDYEEYLNEKVASIEIMKSLYESESIPDVLSKLSEEEYLQLLNDQSMIEKAFKKIDKACATKEKKPVKKNSTSAKAEGDKTSVASEVISEDNSSVVKQVNKEKSMTEKTQVIEQTVEVELIEKSQFDSLQKALDEQKVELQKARDLLAKFEAEKKEAIAKARKETLDKACGKHAEVIFKAVAEADDAVFADVVKALSEMNELVEKSALFQEQGASVSDVDTGSTEQSPIAKALQARLAKQQKQ